MISHVRRLEQRALIPKTVFSLINPEGMLL